MSAVINLKHEPKLREAFEHAQVVDNTVLIDRRTKWGNPFRVGEGENRAQAIARYRADLWRRNREGELALEELAELTAAGWPAGASRGRVMATCSPARQPGRRRCWPRGPMHDAVPCFLSDAVPGRNADGVRAGGKGIADRCAVSLSHTCSVQQPCGCVPG